MDNKSSRPVCRVLVLEDDGGVRELLGDVFDTEGYRFALTATSEEFCAELDTGDIDVAVIDIVVPGVKEPMALARRAAERGCGVILVSGHHDHFEWVEKSGHLFVLKPFRIGALISVVEEALATARRNCAVRNRA